MQERPLSTRRANKQMTFTVHEQQHSYQWWNIGQATRGLRPSVMRQTIRWTNNRTPGICKQCYTIHPASSWSAAPLNRGWPPPGPDTGVQPWDDLTSLDHRVLCGQQCGKGQWSLLLVTGHFCWPHRDLPLDIFSHGPIRKAGQNHSLSFECTITEGKQRFSILRFATELR